MNIRDWTKKLANEMANSIKSLQSSDEILILDIGLFPWNGMIELSAFFTSDLQSAEVYEDDIASWPSYNFSANDNMEWPKVDLIASAMKSDYVIDTKSAEKYFHATANAAKSEIVQSAISKLNCSKGFVVNILHPDDPDKNYM
ncbi:hypothetical protein [Desulfoluna butyratoxydans]|uniref:hypothetical protein n=1 Tax=Desulfoluna butyratoxydans TaxID=231438 RepID=UPI0015D1B1DA|nr:hypothetical protein [Desulfoluna butyratoxydans]